MLRIAVRYANQALFFSPRSEVATLGASEENDFVVPFPGISRRHAQFARRPGGLWIADLGSKNGLQRGDQRHAEIVLAPGETVRIGKASVGLEEISSSDADITLLLPPPKGGNTNHGVPTNPHLASRSESDTDPLFETGGQATPGSALALVRRIETSSRLEPGCATTADLLDRARQTLGAESLVIFEPVTPHSDPVVEAIIGPAIPMETLEAFAQERISTPGDGLALFRLPGDQIALARHLPRRPHALVLAALLPRHSEKPAGWKLDFFDYLAEKLLSLCRDSDRGSEKPRLPGRTGKSDARRAPT